MPKLHRTVFYVRLARISFCAYVDRVREYGVARGAYKFVGVPFCEEIFLCAYLFFAYFRFCVVHHLYINLVNVHRGYTIVDLFISRFWSRFRLQNGYATRRDVCVVIVQCSRSRPCRVCVGGVFFYARISCVPCIISLLILSTCHRGYPLADLFISLYFDSNMVALCLCCDSAV